MAGTGTRGADGGHRRIALCHAIGRFETLQCGRCGRQADRAPPTISSNHDEVDAFATQAGALPAGCRGEGDGLNPFYFGRPDTPLLGAYHPPRGRGPFRRGVVLCYPMGAEYMRAHQTFRWLASLLTENGLHVLRFDYFGTGDSSGQGEDGSPEQWLDDIGSAVDELKATTGIREVSLMGLRLGGTLAAVHASRRTDLDRVVLWDPVVFGATHVAKLTAPRDGLAAVAERPFQPDRRPSQSIVPGPWPPQSPSGTVGVEGFPLTERMRTSISRIDLAALSRLGARSLHLVVSREELHYFRLRDRWRALGLSFQYRFVRRCGGADSGSGGSAGGARTAAKATEAELVRSVVTCLL